MSPVDFEPKVSAGERPQTYALERAATGTDKYMNIVKVKYTLVQALRLCTGREAHRGSRGIAVLYRH